MTEKDIVTTARTNIARYRKLRGYTQTELAKRMKASQRIVAYYESEATSIPLAKLQEFAEALKVSIAALVEDHNGKTTPPEELDIRLVKKLKSIERLPRRARDALWHSINTELEMHDIRARKNVGNKKKRTATKPEARKDSSLA